MRTFLFTLVLFLAVSSFSQGTFLPGNLSARTRVGTIDGPLAGTNFLGQFLVGLAPTSLSPVGPAIAHMNGSVAADTQAVPGIDGGTTVYIQLAAWNRAVWGETFDNVPFDQFGRTDIVPHSLSYSFDPSFAPQFTMPAIVPVPEPSTWALVVLGAGALWCGARARRSKSRPPSSRVPE